MASSKAFIDVRNLTYEYPGLRALDNVSFSIKPNTITALVGPNGAGKTTLLRCISALEQPFSGSVSVDGINSQEDPIKLQKRLGYLSDFFGLYDDLTVKQCLTYLAWSHDIYENLEDRIEDVAIKLNLQKLLNQKAKTLSRGQRQRLAIGQAIIHQPSILLLDEPASGLDPEARVDLSKMLLELKDNGMTIIVSSHILSELEDYSSEMLVLSEGKIKEYVSLKDISESKQQTRTMIVKVTEYKGKYKGIFEKFEQVVNVDVDNENIAIEFSGDDQQQAEFLKYLIDKKIPVCEFIASKKSFENIYIEAMENNDEA